MFERLLEWDAGLFRLLNGRLVHPFLDVALPWITSWSNFRLPLLVLLLLLLLRGPAALRWRLLGLAVTVGLTDLVSSRLLKPLFARPRPGWSLPDVRLLIGARHSGAMPSSHAANLSAAAVFLQLGLKRRGLGLGLLALVAVVGYSRIYVGVHYPSDVGAGALLGAVLGAAGHRLSRLLLPLEGPERRKSSSKPMQGDSTR